MKLRRIKYKFFILPLILGCVIFISYLTKKEGTANQHRQIVEKEGFDKPGEYFKHFNLISRTPGTKKSGYRHNYAFFELQKALKNRSSRKMAGESISWTQRGPGNVGGRTRDVLIDPDDATHATWFAASASGGVWKTIDSGENWRELTDHLPNLATNCIAMAESNHNILYIGTGEGYGGFGMVNGNGIFKSTDKGENWNILTSTLDTANTNFRWINKIAVKNDDENTLLVATNTGLFKTVDGGANWDTVYFKGNLVQDIAVNSLNGNTVYAAVNRLGIIRSYDFGTTWENSYEGIGTGYRFSLAISPVDTNYIFTSVEAPNLETHVYLSQNGADSWYKLNDFDYSFYNFLGTQGWFNNVITAHPFEKNEAFIGGVYLGKVEFKSGTNISDPQVLRVDTLGTGSYMDFVRFGGSYFEGALATGLDEDGEVEEADFSSIEIRFGSGISQLAHRFIVPDGEGAGVPPEDYSYQDYVEVPFQAWDSQTNLQLMVSFRDQDRDGKFNLTQREYDDEIGGREYLFVHAENYSGTPDEDIGQDGGYLYKMTYFLWPTLAEDLENEDWDPENIPESSIAILYGKFNMLNASTSILADNNRNSDLHVDHHALEFAITNAANEEFLLVNANDGGLGISTDKGTSWSQLKDNYPTTQFYGVAKKPYAHEYIGGMQDNGTWQSTPGERAQANTEYIDRVAGDGFEALWHPLYPHRILASTYYNGIRLSNDGGENWSSVSEGINSGPFITRLSHSVQNPDLVFAVGDKGVYRNTNFAVGRYPWDLVVIDGAWAVNSEVTSSHNVKVSLADPAIVWAGAGMFRKPDLNMFVSNDYGESFDSVSLFDYPEGMGYISSIATHPTEPETAYLIFSMDHKPKILRTTNLGESWEDISGFGVDSTSNNGFPDVMVYSLLVFPYDTDKIWAGTEIGIFESTDGGQNWQFADNGLPAVSVWQMFLQDNNVVVATHGRGIWTASEFPGSVEHDGMEDFHLSVFPNPVSHILNIEHTSDVFGAYTLNVYSLEGKLLSSQEGVKDTEKLSQQLDVSSYTPGTYLLSYIIEGDRGSQIFVVR